MISNLQFLRAFAALSVVIYHSQFQLRNGLSTDFYGVSIFFVISGFIMTYVTRDSHEDFFLKRWIRIAPIYAIITIAFFFLTAIKIGGRNVASYILNDGGAEFSHTLVNLGKTIFFIPYQNHVGEYHPLIGAGWTLNIEMYFYAVFGILLYVNRKYAPFLASITIVIVNQIAPMYPGTAWSLYGHPYTYCFIAGIALFYLWKFIEGDTQEILGDKARAIGLACISAVLLFLCCLVPELKLPAVISWLLPSAIVFSALYLHSSGARLTWKPMLLLGEASYVLYIIHLLVLGKINNSSIDGWKFNTSSNFLVFLGAIVISIVISILVHKYVEMPLTCILKAKLLPSRSAGASVSAA